MAQVMCTQTLWRRLAKQGRTSLSVVDGPMPGVALGPWAARLFKDAGRELVLVIEQRTHLTLLFPLAPTPQFQLNLAQALSSGLLDLGVPPALARMECAAIELARLTRLQDPVLRERLDHVHYICGIEFAYHTDLRIIQRNLNDLPHPDIDPCVPIEAVRCLFECGRITRPLISQ
jgi:hypothetical protein